MYRIYKINYTNNKLLYQYGGFGSINYEPGYPRQLQYIRSSEWPPKVDSIIRIKSPDKNIYIGVVQENIWNDTASIVKIENEDYQELSLKDDPNWNNGIGYFLLLSDYLWETADEENEFPDDSPILNGDISKAHNKLSTQYKPSINSVTPLTNKSSKVSLTKLKSKKSQKNQDIFKNDKEPMPLLSDPKKKYFTDNKFDLAFTNTSFAFTSLSIDKIKLLNDKLKSFENIDEKDIKMVVNKSIAVDNLITDPNDEINEGEKITKWIDDVLKEKIFTDLITKIHDGYVYISRIGVEITNKITREIVPELKYFNWQRNKPINYDTLKYVIFQNNFQQNLDGNIEQKKEAENILSQEYVIALQPSPIYQLWALKKFIMIWYGDSEIEPHIRKVKVLINQFRADPTQEYNKKNGILASILIYPKYGSDSAKIVLSKLNYYFSLYVDENDISNSKYQNVQWNDSKPIYFIKKNSLLYYTNGSLELKNYIKDSMSSNNMLLNNSLTADYSQIIESDNIMGI